MPEFAYRLTADRWAFLNVRVTADTQTEADALITAQLNALAGQPHLWQEDDDLNHPKVLVGPGRVSGELDGESGPFQADVTLPAAPSS